MSAVGVLAVAATLAVYYAADALYRRSGRHPLLHPVLLSIAALAALLEAAHLPYPRYMDGARLIAFFLGPATVALAIPIYRNLSAIGGSLPAVIGALVVGSTTAMVSAVGIAWALGAPPLIVRSLAAKSVTTPIAMAVSGEIGGAPALTAVFAILTGIAGAIAVAWIFPRGDRVDWRARGFSTGLASHAIGTAHAFTLDETAGAFSGLAMGLNALFTALVLPLAAALLPHSLRGH